MEKEKKPSYQDELHARVEAWWSADIDVDDVYAFVKQIALESYKNGLKTGRRRSGLDTPRESAKVKR